MWEQWEEHFASILNDSSLDALESLLNRSYWTRMWVLQEYVLAQHIALYYGFQSIEGSPFNGALDRLAQFNPERHLWCNHNV
jgi:hypothetical protein